MEVQSMDKEEVAREKGIYRVTIVGSVVNFLQKEYYSQVIHVILII